MGEIISLGSFNFNQVLGHFQIKPEQKTEAACMKFMYRMMSDELKASPIKALANKEIAKSTIELIGTPYQLYKNYSADFFHGIKEPKYDSLAIAILCSTYINHANGIDIGKDDRTIFHHDFEQNIFEESLLIIEEADMLRAGINSELAEENYNGEEIRPESVFLAHTQTICKFRDIQNSFDEEDNLVLSKVLQEDIPAARDFIFRNTRIGNILDALVENLEDRIIARLKLTSVINGDSPHPLPPTP